MNRLVRPLVAVLLSAVPLLMVLAAGLERGDLGPECVSVTTTVHLSTQQGADVPMSMSVDVPPPYFLVEGKPRLDGVNCLATLATATRAARLHHNHSSPAVVTVVADRAQSSSTAAPPLTITPETYAIPGLTTPDPQAFLLPAPSLSHYRTHDITIFAPPRSQP